VEVKANSGRRVKTIHISMGMPRIRQQIRAQILDNPCCTLGSCSDGRPRLEAHLFAMALVGQNFQKIHQHGFELLWDDQWRCEQRMVKSILITEPVWRIVHGKAKMKLSIAYPTVPTILRAPLALPSQFELEAASRGPRLGTSQRVDMQFGTVGEIKWR